MKKWKKIYELFKQHPRLDANDKKHIEMCESLLALKQPHLNKLVYSKLWQQSWIQTTSYRIFLEDLLGNKSKLNVQIH